MSYIADAHRDWHTETGQTYGCPWDACQPPDDYDEPVLTVEQAEFNFAAAQATLAEARAFVRRAEQDEQEAREALAHVRLEAVEQAVEQAAEQAAAEQAAAVAAGFLPADHATLEPPF